MEAGVGRGGEGRRCERVRSEQPEIERIPSWRLGGRIGASALGASHRPVGRVGSSDPVPRAAGDPHRGLIKKWDTAPEHRVALCSNAPGKGAWP